MDRSIVPNVKKIAVFRATALGDFVFAIPALRAIHETYPQAKITYLGRAWHAQFLPGRLPGVNRVIAVPPARGADIAKGLVIDPDVEQQFLREMQAERFDLAFQMQGGGEYSNRFITAFQARVSAGARTRNALALDRWIPYTYYQSELVRLLDIAALAGAQTSTENVQPHLAPLLADFEQVQEILARLPGPFVVIHPGSTDPRRCWSPDYFAQAANYCWEKYRLEVVIAGIAYEADRSIQIERAMVGPVHNLTNALSLPALLALLSKASLFIGNDSGPLHLALAAGTMSVGVFWVEYVVNSLPLSRERFLPVIAWNRTCPACGEVVAKSEADNPRPGKCTHAVSFVDTVRPGEVMAAIDQLADYAGLPAHQSDRPAQPR